MVDKVKPLKIETATDGSQANPFPVETNPDEDYISAKGMSFENSDDFLVEKVGGMIKVRHPDRTFKPTLSGDDITVYEIFSSPVQIDANRLMKGDFTYVGDNLTAETWVIYDPADGTTILRTVTVSHTYSGDDLIKSERVEV